MAIPGSLEAIASLNHAGHTVAITTNQSGRGLPDEQGLARVHQKLSDELQRVNGHIDQIFYCPHHPEEACCCRKPKPDLLPQIQQYYQCDLQGIPIIVDSESDIQLAQTLACKPILVRTGYGEAALKNHNHLCEKISVFPNVTMVVAALLAER